ALRETGWNVSRASAHLGITRNTLRYWIEKLGLRPGMPAPPPPSSPAGAPPAEPLAAVPAALRSETPVSAIRWESRRLVLLSVFRFARDSEPATPWLGGALGFVVDKMRGLGGRVEAWTATAVVAAFGLEPVDDVPGRAAHAALAIQTRAERTRGA